MPAGAPPCVRGAPRATVGTMDTRTHGRYWLAGGILLGLLALGQLGLPMETEGPTPLQFAVHRFDLAILGCVAALVAAAAPERRRRRRRRFVAMVLRGLKLRVGWVLAGGVVLKAAAAVGSPQYWDHPATSVLFHLLGPARMVTGQSLAVSGLGLCCTSEVLNHLAGEIFGELPRLYLFLAFDSLIFAWLGMAAERGLPAFRVLQVVSRIGLTVAMVSVPLAFYGDRIGYWGVEPFAWLFSGLALAVLIPLAHRK